MAITVVNNHSKYIYWKSILLPFVVCEYFSFSFTIQFAIMENEQTEFEGGDMPESGPEGLAFGDMQISEGGPGGKLQ